MCSVQEKLDHFIRTNKVPHIIFHGPSGGGKRTLVNKFLREIYGSDQQKISDMTIFVNCAHGKGIKFVREELNIFAKTHINYKDGQFKSIILSNADELTIDAQSALRRCIELYSHHTRFFVITESPSKLLRPIHSRFCEIYVPPRKMRAQSICQNTETRWFHNFMASLSIEDPVDAVNASNALYQKGYAGVDVMNWLEHHNRLLSDAKMYELLMAFQQVKREFRNEASFILFVLIFVFLRSDTNLECIDEM